VLERSEGESPGDSESTSAKAFIESWGGKEDIQDPGSNKLLQQTAAAIRLPESSLSLGAAAAAELMRL
jgi:hypothetical protein